MTASALHRYEACPPSYSLPWVYEPPDAPTEGGSVKHLFVVEAVILGREKALANVPAEWRAECAAIDVEATPHATGGYVFEVAFAYEVANDAAVELARGVKDRSVYEGVDGETQMGGIADLVGLTDDAVVILDLKTGWKWLPRPKESLQLLFLALAAARAYGRSKAYVGWIRLVDSTPRLVVDALDSFDLEEARDRILRLRRRAQTFEWLQQKPTARVDVTIGPHCKYCPGLRGCWAHTSALPEGPLTASAVDHVEHLERRAKVAKAQLREQVRQTPLDLGEGRVFGLHVTQQRRIDAGKAMQVLAARHPNLDVHSLASVTQDAMKKAGLDVDAEMEALAAAGAVIFTEVEKVEAHKP